MDPLGLIHMIFGLVALVAGAAVMLMRKGTRWHRTLGHVYLTTMVGLNGTGLFIYDLFGAFGPFHWMALASLATLAVGRVAVLARRPRANWLTVHAGFMAGSYVGLVAAAASEVTTRLPGNPASFSPAVTAITSLVVIVVGASWLMRTLSQMVARVSEPRRVR